jgi:hypothetical protein
MRVERTPPAAAISTFGVMNHQAQFERGRWPSLTRVVMRTLQRRRSLKCGKGVILILIAGLGGMAVIMWLFAILEPGHQSDWHLMPSSLFWGFRYSQGASSRA